ncbi:unnamed protein product [Ambrosiozyma monospora]|uniref:Unnamed protein product n=1 Tax=Ambrosiozyma monospora TaxID=43982 RepID=A0ACB5UA31_AMBMO|nr:unnamed protein product [Ambrosiozyma monospora]
MSLINDMQKKQLVQLREELKKLKSKSQTASPQATPSPMAIPGFAHTSNTGPASTFNMAQQPTPSFAFSGFNNASFGKPNMGNAFVPNNSFGPNNGGNFNQFGGILPGGNKPGNNSNNPISFKQFVQPSSSGATPSSPPSSALSLPQRPDGKRHAESEEPPEKRAKTEDVHGHH